MDNTFFNNLEWRTAIKKFDSNKRVSESYLSKVLTAIRLAPSSFGIQPFHVFVIEEKRIRRKLKLKSYMQPQVVDAAYLLVFCARTDVTNLIDKYIKMASKGNKLARIKLEPRRLAMIASYKSKTSGQLLEWSRQQVYIALGFGLAACAELRIDSCPMGGFMSDQVDKILALPDNMKSTVYLAIGYRKDGALRDKIRFSDDDLFTHI